MGTLLIQFLQSDNQQGSFSRLSGLLLIVTYCFCAIWQTLSGKGLVDFPAIGAGLVTSLYWLNKKYTAVGGDNGHEPT